MAVFLPLFPLQLVVFPGESLNLHIFEPRYRQLIGECEQTGGAFGIPAYLNDEVQSIATEVALVAVEKRYAGGELDIRTQGVGLLKVRQFYRQASGKLYPGGEVERLSYTTDGDAAAYETLLTLATELFAVLRIDKPLPADPESFSTYDIAHHVGLSLEQEYQLLGIPEERRRQEFLLAHLEQMLPVVQEMERLRERVRMNGHFRNITPPGV